MVTEFALHMCAPMEKITLGIIHISVTRPQEVAYNLVPILGA